MAALVKQVRLMVTGCALTNEAQEKSLVLTAAGGSAPLYGTSSGAALALEAARTLSGITKLALWEPPYQASANNPRPPADAAKTLSEMAAAGRRGDAVEFFMTKVVGLPSDFVAFARTQPWWAAQEALAHTLAYDATIMGDFVLPKERIAAIKIPTIVMDGGASFPFMHETADAMVQILPKGQRCTLAGQQHNVAPEAIAPVLVEFF